MKVCVIGTTGILSCGSGESGKNREREFENSTKGRHTKLLLKHVPECPFPQQGWSTTNFSKISLDDNISHVAMDLMQFGVRLLTFTLIREHDPVQVDQSYITGIYDNNIQRDH